ncbi:antitoxin VapB family protein [Candidatus Bathyarchaeota archaeon]|nr:antitoxin VapB family protein [Candidatus Bathyarchaeota archaeon]
MGKVIMLSDDVYKRLKMMKGPGESFSDVIERLLKYKPKLTEIAGSKTITIKDWRKVKESLKVREKLDEERRKYLLGLLGE